MGNQNSKTWDVHQAETHLQDRAVVVVLAQSRVVAHPAAEAHHDAALPAIPVEAVVSRIGPLITASGATPTGTAMGTVPTGRALVEAVEAAAVVINAGVSLEMYSREALGWTAEGVACRYPRRALRTTACIRAGGVLVLDITCPLPRVQEEHKHRGKKEN